MLSFAHLTGSADAFVTLCGVQGARCGVVFAVVPGIPDMDRLHDDLDILCKAPRTPHLVPRILDFPPLLPGDKSALGARIKVTSALKAWSISPYPLVVLAPFPALATPLAKQGPEPLEMGSFALSEAAEKLSGFGYTRKPQVEMEGDFSIRGGILDVWSPGEEFPLRAEFFGEDLESLRLFDPATQCSIERTDSATILPIEDGEKVENVGGEAEKNGSVFDLLPEGASILAFDADQYTLPFAQPLTELPLSALPGFAELGADEAHHPELFEAARQKLEQHLNAADKRGDLILRLDELSGGFEIDGLIVVTKADRVFAKHHTRIRSKKHSELGERLNDFDELEPGEYVVHVDYGVGKYIGSSFVRRDDEQVEVFNIEYADGAILHVPAVHAHLLSRYVGVKGMDVKVHRLDGKRWSKDKAEAERAVQDLAAQLLTTQAKREVVPGFAYDVECEGLDAFEAAFPYEETPDQVTAIAAIKSDLARTKPMDRLVCGDAGYGKTEVAMRAAYIAALNGKQVAVLAPTTVLAEQHFETFTSRFDGTPVRIESVSRFQTSGTHAGTFKRLATGACDIVIGTHAILTSKIAFRDLGLIIIDEEQRFGVKHKEFLKTLRATADILTLSATPIPRTLYLSMTGARDLSLLRSPPRERVAVETHIEHDSDALIYHAITRELERGGQVFYLHNRVTTIGKVEKRLKGILPSARIVVAHGQMDTKTLAHKMRQFEHGEYDILLSTTIVESGIDIPRANTIIVDHAEMFGLAELYQLRGRVGRSSKQGYAYFLLPGEGLVDSDARERLNALQRHGGLGSGFNLAVRDLELRGAGNLLGSKQSGHIANIGFTLYCQLLQRTIARMKGERVREVIDVRLNLDFYEASIPFEYVEEEVQRLSLMKRFAEAMDLKVITALRSEMEDRFGPLPPEAERFVRLAKFRLRCASKGISAIDVKGSRAVFYEAKTNSIRKVLTLRKADPDAKLRELDKAL